MVYVSMVSVCHGYIWYLPICQECLQISPNSFIHKINWIERRGELRLFLETITLMKMISWNVWTNKHTAKQCMPLKSLVTTTGRENKSYPPLLLLVLDGPFKKTYYYSMDVFVYQTLLWQFWANLTSLLKLCQNNSCHGFCVSKYMG